MENYQQKDLTNVLCNDYYGKVQDINDSAQACMKKNQEMLRDLRISAAEIEVETTAHYHAKLLQSIVELVETHKPFEDFVSKTEEEIKNMHLD